MCAPSSKNVELCKWGARIGVGVMWCGAMLQVRCDMVWDASGFRVFFLWRPTEPDVRCRHRFVGLAEFQWFCGMGCGMPAVCIV